MKLLSIVTPVWNGAKFLKKSMDAIQALEIPFEHIVVDGGSTDGTLEIIAQYPDVKLIHQKEKTGMYGAIQMGILEAKGEYVTYINCDDNAIKDGYEAMYHKAIETQSDLTYSDGQLYYLEKDKYVSFRARKFPRFFLKSGFMPFIQPCTIYRKDAFDKIGGFRYETFRHWGDLDFFRRISAMEGSTISYSPRESVSFLKYEGSFAVVDRTNAIKEEKLLGKVRRNFFTRTLFRLC